MVQAIEAADAGVIVCGPADEPTPSRDSMRGLALSTGFPVLADPLSGIRWGGHVTASGVTVCGGYDGYLGAFDQYPDVIIRFGASPTSKSLRTYLSRAGQRGARQFIIDPAGGWREAEFTATDLVIAAETPLAAAISGRVNRKPGSFETDLMQLEHSYWRRVQEETRFIEGDVLADVAARIPDPATLFVSNSMPVRDLDRFGQPRDIDLTVLGNRGASGIDGIASTALGAGSATDDPLVLVTGDLAYYHDLNGLLAVGRNDVDATIILLNNDGGGIFRLLPVESFDPPFTAQFHTPHDLDFEPTADLYDLAFARTDSREVFRTLFAESLTSDGTQIIETVFDSETSHRGRETLADAVHRWTEKGEWKHTN
jgi:2-succinyl-5-enolpyruvyl-6-hydroxy-3-cyclohexene-1-carboxylate synthase